MGSLVLNIADCIHDDQLFVVETTEEKRLYINDGSEDSMILTCLETCPVLNIESGLLMVADLAPSEDSVEESAIFIYVEESVRNLSMMFYRRSLGDFFRYLEVSNTKFKNAIYTVTDKNINRRYCTNKDGETCFTCLSKVDSYFIDHQTIQSISEAEDGSLLIETHNDSGKEI